MWDLIPVVPNEENFSNSLVNNVQMMLHILSVNQCVIFDHKTFFLILWDCVLSFFLLSWDSILAGINL